MFESKIKAVSMTLVAFALLAFSYQALAGSAHLTWNANSEDDLAGYKLYYDTVSHAGTCPTGYAQSQLTGNVTSYWFDHLTPGQRYYFQLTALDTSNNESGCSTDPGEVSKLVTFRSDFNNSHKVDIFDFAILSANFNQTDCGNVADITRNCVVDIFEFAILSQEFLGEF